MSQETNTPKDIHYQTETIKYSTGQTAGTKNYEITLNSDYDRCIGVAVFESSDGGLPTYRLSLTDRSLEYLNTVPKAMLMSDSAAGLNMNNRFLRTNIKAGGNKVKVLTVLDSILTKDLEYDIVFLLERPQKRA